MNATSDPGPGRADDDLAQADVTAMLRYGLSFHGAHRTALFGDGAVAAANQLDRLGVPPRAVAFLAKVVRNGGVGYAAELDAPLPGADAADAARSWLETAATVASGPDGDEDVARWLEAVAELLAFRHRARAATGA